MPGAGNGLCPIPRQGTEFIRLPLLQTLIITGFGGFLAAAVQTIGMIVRHIHWPAGFADGQHDHHNGNRKGQQKYRFGPHAISCFYAGDPQRLLPASDPFQEVFSNISRNRKNNTDTTTTSNSKSSMVFPISMNFTFLEMNF